MRMRIHRSEVSDENVQSNEANNINDLHELDLVGTVAENMQSSQDISTIAPIDLYSVESSSVESALDDSQPLLLIDNEKSCNLIDNSANVESSAQNSIAIIPTTEVNNNKIVNSNSTLSSVSSKALTPVVCILLTRIMISIYLFIVFLSIFLCLFFVDFLCLKEKILERKNSCSY